MVYISPSVAEVIVIPIVMALSLIYRRHCHVRSYNLKSTIELKPLLESVLVNENCLDRTRWLTKISGILTLGIHSRCPETYKIDQWKDDISLLLFKIAIFTF